MTTTRTTRRSRPFMLDCTSHETIDATAADIADELARIEETCNRCDGRGHGWGGYAGGTCHRCNGTGSAATIARRLLAEVADAHALLDSPGRIWMNWVHANRPAASAGIDFLAYQLVEAPAEVLASRPLAVAIFVAVVEGRQRGPLRADTIQRLRDESWGRVAA